MEPVERAILDQWKRAGGEYAMAAEAVEKEMNHTKDEDCTLDEDFSCIECGVWHGDPCPDCGGRGFHRDNCPEMGEEVTE